MYIWHRDPELNPALISTVSKQVTRKKLSIGECVILIQKLILITVQFKWTENPSD